MIGDFRTDALHDALGRAPIEDDMLMALLVLSFAGQNVRVDSGAGGVHYGGTRFGRHAARLFTRDGRLSFDRDTLRVAARAALIDVFSCRRGISNSGVVSLVAGHAIGADGYLANMGTEEFLACLSRQSLETAAKGVKLQPCARVRETRAALVEHFKAEAVFVHPCALFAPDPKEVADLIRYGDHFDGSDDEAANVIDGQPADAAAAGNPVEPVATEFDDGEGTLDDHETAFGIAAE
ncbi:hypothetical protein N182_34890 [Sinorhizobium sp. GL2]|nr:hypothetical protein N182_34890 [Sinorhizobium sp. GL2]